MAVASCHAKELSAFILGQGLLIFKTTARQSSKDVYASLTLLLKPLGSQSGHREQLQTAPEPSAVMTVTSLGLFQ